ncbi:tetratricopeptide repeat domain 27 [Imleria badia]|nr:tetratricopeptide repeat domain 27 [Imleria badia]
MNVDLLETCLLVGRWDDKLTHSLASCPATKLAKAVVDGHFRAVLTSSYAQQLFSVHPSVTTDEPFERLLQWTLPSVSDAEEQELVRLVLGVACLHAFIQANWTGPDLDVKPSDVLVFPQHPHPHPASISDSHLNSKAITELAYGGEPAYHLAQSAPFLRFAQIIFNVPHVHLTYTPWWRLRVSIVHQQVLDESVPLPSDVLGSLIPLVERTTSDPDLGGRLQLEQGLLEHIFSHDKSAAECFVRAARATGLQYELTGALGKRTKFQQNALSQLVLLAESRKRDDDVRERSSAGACAPVGSMNGSHSQQDGSEEGETGVKSRVPETLPLNDDTLLEQTEFTSSNPSTTALLSHLDPSSQPPLHPLDQCILLSLCFNVRNTSPSHGLTNEQMSPYVARVISYPRNWSVHTMALLLRSRLESTRTRTVERSTLQLQALVDQMPTADSELSERLRYFHAIPLPSKWEMERELALRYLSIGVVKSALEIFERLEMWEEVVKCWQAMERRDQAIAIVRDLLQGQKEEADSVISKGKDVSSARRTTLDSAREAKLWCLLGDLEPEHAVAHYERAWRLSRETSGRAMRSLGGYYFAREEFENAVPCLLRAVAINPLLSRPWFIMGCAYIRMEDWEGARDAFTRCVGIDDEDAESWNNLATVYLRLDKAHKDVKEEGGEQGSDAPSRTVSFSNKTLAFRALKQGLKYRYENWRMWSNYMIVAMDVGELSEACRAQSRIVEERAAKIGAECVDEQVLARLVDAVTRVPVDPDHVVAAVTVTQAGPPGNDTTGAAEQRDAVMNPNEGGGLLKRVLDLFERTILPRVSAPSIFYAYARLLARQTRWEDALKAYLDGYRCGTVETFEKGDMDVENWREAVREVEAMVDVLRNFGPRVQGLNWSHQGRSIVRTFVGRSRDFQDEPEWSRLLEIQDELRKEA